MEEQVDAFDEEEEDVVESPEGLNRLRLLPVLLLVAVVDAAVVSCL